MEKTPEEILLKLIESSDAIEVISDKNTSIVIYGKGRYYLYLSEEILSTGISYYTLFKDKDFTNKNTTGVVFKYKPISSEFMWKHLKGEAPKQELIKEIFE